MNSRSATIREAKVLNLTKSLLRVKMNRLFANTAFSAFLRTMPTVLTVFAGMTRIGTSAGSREDIDLIDQKNGQHDLSQDGE
jgi:hypothetical protein